MSGHSIYSGRAEAGPTPQSMEDRIQRLRRTLERGKDFRTVPRLKADVFQIMVNGTDEDRQALDEVIRRAERKFPSQETRIDSMLGQVFNRER